jgi:serine O-acetyltransferase
MTLLRADLDAAQLSWPRALARLLVLDPFWLVAAYRCAHWLGASSIRFLPALIHGWARVIWAADISPSARIGGGLLIPHPAGVVVGEDVVCGDRLTLYQGTTLGSRGGRRSYEQDGPRLGDGVTVGAGGCVLGPVTVGDDVWIGANAVVLEDVPAGSTAVGRSSSDDGYIIEG